MKNILIPTVLVCACLPFPAHSEQAPVRYSEDIRIKRFVYQQNDVYKLDQYMKSVTALQFDDGEDVQSILIGDSASWEVVKLKAGNVVSVKPIIDRALTNMTIYTDRRVYSFELRSLGEIQPGTNPANLSFRTTFTYPDDKSRDEEEVPVSGPMRADYMVSGSAPFRPVAVADNALQTTFVLPKGAPRPAVFKVGLDRKERLVNSRTQNDRIVVDGISDYWVLRIGDEAVCVGRYGAIRTGVSKQKVVRHVR